MRTDHWRSTPDNAGTITRVTIPSALDGPFGRLRAARLAPDGGLIVTTSNGSNDKVLRIDPKAVGATP